MFYQNSINNQTFLVSKSNEKLVALIPTRANNKFDKKINLDNYKIYPIIDGTTVTLYNVDDKWHIATSAGYSVGHYVWLNNRKYEDVLLECKKDLFEVLDKNMSHTFIFTHFDYHPFQNNGYTDLVFIQSWHEERGVVYDVPYEGAKLYEPLEGKFTFNRLKNDTRFDYHHLKSGFLPHYGYVLKTDVEGEKDYIMESNLFKKIRLVFYHGLKKYRGAEKIKYIVIRAIVYGKCGDVLYGYRGAVDYYTKKIEKLCVDLCTYNKGNSNNKNHVLEYFSEKLKNVGGITPTVSANKKLIRDFIMNPNNINDLTTFIK